MGYKDPIAEFDRARTAAGKEAERQVSVMLHGIADGTRVVDPEAVLAGIGAMYRDLMAEAVRALMESDGWRALMVWGRRAIAEPIHEAGGEE